MSVERIVFKRSFAEIHYISALNKMFKALFNGTAKIQYRMFTDGTTTFRQGIRNGAFVLDKTLTATGFDGTEDADWENVESTV